MTEKSPHVGSKSVSKRKFEHDSVKKSHKKLGKRRKLKKKYAKAIPTVVGTKHVGSYNVRDLSSLIAETLTSEKIPPLHFEVKNERRIPKLVLLQLEGLKASDFGLKDKEGKAAQMNIKKARSELPSMSGSFHSLMRFSMPGSNWNTYPLFQSVASLSMNKKAKQKLTNQNGNTVTLDGLCLKCDQLQAAGYAIHESVVGATKEMKSKFPKYVSTKKFSHKGPKVFSLDCEMVRIGDGRLVLARVSMVDWNGKTVMEELVKPKENIVDYLTPYSGITEEMLKDVTTNLSDIQQKMIGIVSSDDILIGHSLDSDLRVLELKHPLIIDTSECYDHANGPPLKPSLRWLTKVYLNRDIQNSSDGHDSMEDCTACLDLVKLKMDKTYMFGKVSRLSLFSKIPHMNKMELDEDGNKVPKSSIVIDYSNLLENLYGPQKGCLCNNDDDPLKYFKENEADYDLMFIRDNTLQHAKESDDEDEISKAYQKVDTNFKEMYELLPKYSLMIVCFGNGTDSRQLRGLQQRRRDARKNQEDDTWTSADDKKLKSQVAAARRSYILVGLKH